MEIKTAFKKKIQDNRLFVVDAVGVLDAWSPAVEAGIW